MNPLHGVGVALRQPHLSLFLSEPPKTVQWVEVISENYFPLPGESWDQSEPIHQLLKVRKNFPVSLHGVSLSLGTAGGLNRDSLKRLKLLADRIEPFQISDHLCWTGADWAGTRSTGSDSTSDLAKNSHDLLPLPYTEEAIQTVAQAIDEVQTVLKRPLLIENLSSYVTFNDSEMSEWEFLQAVVKHSGCQILLDINNIYVSSINHRFDPLTYVRSIPVEAVQEIHLAGHSRSERLIIDTHDAPVSNEVWRLYEQTLKHVGRRNTLIERDSRIPPWEDLERELLHLRTLYETV